jgi:hypothetical protein
MMKRLFAIGAVAIACVSAPNALGAQTVDSTSHTQRAPHSQLIVGAMRFCTDCGVNMRFDKPRGVRILDANERVLFMSAGNPATFVWATPQAEALNDLNDSHLKRLDITNAATAARQYGKQYANGIVSVTLNTAGAEAWTKAVAERAAKQR